MSSGITLGSPRSVVATPELTIADVDYPPGARFHPHMYECGYIAGVLRGGWSDTVRTTSRAARTGTLLMMPGGGEHENSIGPDGARAVIITIGTNFCAHPLNGWQCWSAPRLSAILFRVHHAHAMGGETEIEACRELLIAFFESLDVVRMAEEPGTRACVTRAQRIIHTNFNESLRLSDIADEINCGFAYLSRAFRTVMRCTMGEYLPGVRARHAACLLANSRQPTSEIAAN
jgi:hypothetical protein